jgi:hypothetical protein
MKQAGDLRTEAASEPQAAARPKRSWLMGCVMASVIVLCFLALAGTFWARHVGKERDRLAAHVRALIDEYEASKPALPEEDNAAPRYRAAFKKLAMFNTFVLYEDGLNDRPGNPSIDFSKAEVKAFLESNQDYLDTLRAAADLPACDFHPDLSRGFAWPKDTDFYEFLRAAEFLAIAARHEAQSGRGDQALERLDLGLRVCMGLDKDLVFCLVIRNRGLSTIWRAMLKVLNESEPSAAALDRLLVASSKERATGLRGGKFLHTEKIMAAAEALRLVDKTGLINNGECGREWDALDGSPRSSRVGAFLWRAGFFAKDVRLLEDHLKQMPPAETILSPQVLDELATLRERWERSPLPPWAILSQAFLRRSDRLSVPFSLAPLACADLARLTLGCRLHRLKTGAYPETLAALSAKLPEHFKELPADPFTGKPFNYQRTEAGCKIWSVGRDRTDNGGDRQKDIVFELKK